MRKIPALLLFATLLLVTQNCNYVQKIRDGKTAYERKQYFVAVKMLKKEYSKAKSRKEKGRIAFLLAESYKNLNKSDSSLDWYQNAYDYAYGVEALKEYAYGLKKAERYKEAFEAFKNLGLEIGSPYEYRRELQACQVALGWKADKYVEYQVEPLDFNTGFADYSPTLYEGDQMVFTSDRTSSTGKDTYNWTGNQFSDLFLVDLNSNDVKPFDARLNTANNEGTVAFSSDYSEVYFTRCFDPNKKVDAHCKIMVSERQGEGWSLPRMLDFIEDGINYGHPSLSADGQKLYFSCNHPDGWGGYDIYVAERTSDGWSAPTLLSRSINTIGNEKFPTVDGDTLYFSSDFHNGMGGLDIFKSYVLSNGSWSSPYNLKFPINSGGDDFGLIIDYDAPKKKGLLQTGYFSSTRNDGIGNDDIYRFEKIIPPPRPPKPEPEVVVEHKMILNGYVLEKIYEDPTNPNSTVLGRKPLSESKVSITFGKQKQEVTVSEDGLFTLELDKETDYDFIASHPGYLNNDARFSSKGIGEDPNNPVQTFEIEIVLDRIFLDQEIVLENIYYDFDESFIREDAKPTLNELIRNLELNPNIRIQMSSHTDCRGARTYNENLSQRRAQAAVDYLISSGIDATRLLAKGYGENEPEIDCICSRCTEDQHQENRRTTFKILDTGTEGL